MRLSLGDQWVIELFGCGPDRLTGAGTVEEIMVSAARITHSSDIKSFFRDFNSHGVSGMVSIPESRLSVHTWPERGYAAIDIFTSGEALTPERMAEYIAGRFEARQCCVYRIPRGIFNEKGEPAPPKRLMMESVKTLGVPKLVKAANILFGLIF